MRKYRVHPVIMARSEINVDPEFMKEGATEQTIFTSLAAKMQGARPVDIKKAVERVKSQLEAARNLKTLESMGVRVAYHALDVTDAEAVKDVISKYEKIDGVIHAAGLEESQTLPKKDMKTFNAVFDTKIEGALNLLSALKDRNYRYFMGFSSVAARFGNYGQADYSAANEMLTRMLQVEKRKHVDRAYKVFDWTAWGEVGMATKESVVKFLSSTGLEFLSVKAGVEFFMKDLTDSKEDEALITNQVPAFDRDGLFSQARPEYGSAEYPFLGKLIEKSAKHAKYLRVLDIKNDTFIDHHTRDNVGLFLGSTGLETMAEAAASIQAGDRVLVEVRDFSIPYSIKILQRKPKDLIVSVLQISDNEYECSISSQFMKDGRALGLPTLHYRGVYVFADSAPVAPRADIPSMKKVTWEGNLEELLYHPQRLFMEPLFRTIKDIPGTGVDMVATRLHNTYTGSFFAHIDEPRFQVAPVVVDGVFQTGGLVEFMGASNVILPYRIGKLTIFSGVETHGEYTCVMNLVGRDDAEKTRSFDIDLIDSKGKRCMRFEKFQMIVTDRVPAEHIVSHKFRVEE